MQAPSEQPEPDKAHCRLAPSSAYRWLGCPGSARDDLPDESSPASEEGSLAHARAHATLEDVELGEEYTDLLAQLSDEAFDEMTAGVALYVDFVRGIPGEAYTEHKLLSGIIPEYGGTIDRLNVTEDTLHVTDFKYGQMYVPAENNAQLKSYLGLAREHFPGRSIFRATIVQPRVNDGRIDTVEFSADELDAHVLAVIEASVDDSLRADSWCKWCPLLGSCDVAYAHARVMADEEFDVIEDTESPEHVKRCVEIVEFAPVVKRMSDLAQQRMLIFIQHGGTIEGYKAAMSLGHRAWTDPDALIAALKGADIDTSELYEAPKLKSPAKLERVVPKSVLEPHYHRPQRGLTVVPASSKMQEVVFNEFDALPQ